VEFFIGLVRAEIAPVPSSFPRLTCSSRSQRSRASSFKAHADRGWRAPLSGPLVADDRETMTISEAAYPRLYHLDFNIVAGGALRGAGDTRWMATATFNLAYFVFLSAAMVLAFPTELAATGYMITLAGFLFTRFARGQWQHIGIFSEDAAVAE